MSDNPTPPHFLQPATSRFELAYRLRTGEGEGAVEQGLSALARERAIWILNQCVALGEQANRQGLFPGRLLPPSKHAFMTKDRHPLMNVVVPTDQEVTVSIDNYDYTMHRKASAMVCYETPSSGTRNRQPAGAEVDSRFLQATADALSQIVSVETLPFSLLNH
jgi:hypothetical protein